MYVVHVFVFSFYIYGNVYVSGNPYFLGSLVTGSVLYDGLDGLMSPAVIYLK